MSGASANAAARRRRGVTAANPTPNYTTTQNNSSKIQQSPAAPPVPNLTIPQTLMFLDSRLSKIEQKLSSTTETMLDINGNIDVSLLCKEWITTVGLNFHLFNDNNEVEIIFRNGKKVASALNKIEELI